MRVLIVDDEEIALELLMNALTASGHEVETAADGVQALHKLHDGDLRLVISDWEMPGMNGEDLCRAVRAEGFAGYIYFILLTVHGSADHIVRGLSAGADDFMVKPFNPAELTVRIRAGERVLSLESRDLALFAMAKLAESRDPETGRHLNRVRSYCRLLAQWFQHPPRPGYEVNGSFVETIYQTSPLHDIGKVGIPDSILLKNGRLSDQEFKIMKSHTTVGAGTLDAALQQFPSAQFLRMARDIAYSHHERFDGSGYPRALAGQDIPLCGRITALADVYDALTSKRVYKIAFEHQVARSILTQESGGHFDPLVVEAFLANEERFITLCRELTDQEPGPSGHG